jgi:hypothetical protein
MTGMKTLIFRQVMDNRNNIKESRGTHHVWQDVEQKLLDDVSWQPFQTAGNGAPAR